LVLAYLYHLGIIPDLHRNGSKMSAANYGNPAIGEPLAAFAQASPGSELETLS